MRADEHTDEATGDTGFQPVLVIGSNPYGLKARVTADVSCASSAFIGGPEKPMDRIVIELKKATPAVHDCLPHAAMNLGAPRGVGMRPVPGMVSRLIIQPQFDAWCLFRMDERGGFVGDSWHPTKEDALHQARREFGAENIGDVTDV